MEVNSFSITSKSSVTTHSETHDIQGNAQIKYILFLKIRFLKQWYAVIFDKIIYVEKKVPKFCMKLFVFSYKWHACQKCLKGSGLQNSL